MNNILVLAGRAKGMMAERLAVSEGKLMKLHEDQVIQNLVAAKLELAQSQYETLEIRVRESTNSLWYCQLIDCQHWSCQLTRPL